MDFNQYFQLYLQKKLQEDAQKKNSSLGTVNNYASKINQVGKNMQLAGDLMNTTNNATLQNIGSKISNVGNSLSNGATAVTDVTGNPVAYFKGFAGGAGTGAGTSGAISNAIQAEAPIATGVGSIAGGNAAATLGSSAAGAGTAAGTGSAAGGAAAGGASGTGGAAAAGPIGALVALGVMAAMGTHRKAAKKSGEQLLSATTQEAEAGNQDAEQRLNQAETNTNVLQNQANNAISQGVPNNQSLGTGYAAPVINTNDNTVTQYQNYLKNNGYSDDVVNGVAQGLNNGNKDIADWINQYNSGAEGQTNPIRIPTTDEEIALAKKGEFNVPVQNANANVSKNKTIIDKLANGLGDFAKGFQENKTTAFAPENMYSDDSKGIMNRVGEGVGTIARALDKPATQALIAGGATALAGGGLAPALSTAYKVGLQRGKTNLYQDALKRNGVNIDPGAWGSLSSSDMNTLMTPQYKQQENDLKKIYYENLANYHNGILQDRQNRTENDKNYKEKKLGIDQQNANSKQTVANARQTSANASVIRANNSGKKGGSSKKITTTKPQQHKDWNNDLSQYSQVLTNPRLANRLGEAKARFIQKYGVDPDKYIKL